MTAVANKPAEEKQTARVQSLAPYYYCAEPDSSLCGSFKIGCTVMSEVDWTMDCLLVATKTET